MKMNETPAAANAGTDTWSSAGSAANVLPSVLIYANATTTPKATRSQPIIRAQNVSDESWTTQITNYMVESIDRSP